MGKLVDGQWHTDWYEPDEEGNFVRPDTEFHDWVKSDASSAFAPQAGRYHLYVSYACPWAHRTLIMRSLKHLEDAISVSVVHPYMGDDGWSFATDFAGASGDAVNQCELLREIYTKADSNYTGRVTVPVLWDKQTQTIVNNESRDILRMLDTEFGTLARNPQSYAPEDIRERVDATIEMNYEPINNGVYKCGFADSQQAYDKAFAALFDALDHCEEILSNNRYLCGKQLTEADICLFTTLYRFDQVYHTHFKCNRKRIVDYPNLWNYVRDIYQTDQVAQTCHMDHIKTHYYRSHPDVNPKQLIAGGPELDFNQPHNRAAS